MTVAGGQCPFGHINREGRDTAGPTPSTRYVKKRKRKAQRATPQVKRDDAKFEAALTKALGPEFAKDYMSRKRRRET